MSYYRFIEPQYCTPREPELAIDRDTVLSAINWIVRQEPGLIFYDLETTGLNFHDPNNVITNIGLACADWLIGLNLVDVTHDEQQPLWDWLRRQQLGGFNLGFDLAWPWGPDVAELDVVSDTLLWFRLLATEGHSGQSHSLESLIENVLQWPAEYLQKEWLQEALATRGLAKDEMWRLALEEPQAYTRYCALDAEASMQGDYVLQETVESCGFEHLRDYFREIIVPAIKRQVRATYNGVPIDRDMLLRNTEWVRREMVKVEAQIYNHPDMQPILAAWTEQQFAKDHRIKVTVKKRWAKESEQPWKYPDKYMIAPCPADKCPAWSREFGGKFYEPKRHVTVSGQNKTGWPRLNFSSQPQMHMLIYEYLLKDKWTKWTRQDDPNSGLVYVDLNDKRYSVDLTKSGGLPIGGDILDLIGPVGKLIQEYKSLETLLGNFLEKYEMASRKTGRIHAQAKILSTVTGRMAGGSE